MSRIALYTATLGAYESPYEVLPEAKSTENSVDCYRFVDSMETGGDATGGDAGGHVAEPRWRYVRQVPRVPGDHIRDARAIKILGDSSLLEYDVTIWVDNRVRLKIGAEELVDRFLPDGADLALPVHSYHKSLTEEFDAVLRGRLDDPRRVREQRLAYSHLDISSEPVYWTAIIIRRNNDRVRKFNDLWWEQVLRFSRRDQLSFPYVRHANPELIVAPFTINNIESEFHEWRKVTDVGRAPTAGVWLPPSLRSEFRDVAMFANTMQRGVLRDIMPEAAVRGAKNLQDRLRRMRARQS